jgi:hypothetical protein
MVATTQLQRRAAPARRPGGYAGHSAWAPRTRAPALAPVPAGRRGDSAGRSLTVCARSGAKEASGDSSRTPKHAEPPIWRSGSALRPNAPPGIEKGTAAETLSSRCLRCLSLIRNPNSGLCQSCTRLRPSPRRNVLNVRSLDARPAVEQDFEKGRAPRQDGANVADPPRR